MWSFISPESIAKLQETLGGPAAWILFGLMVLYIVLKFYDITLKTMRADEDSRLQRAAMARQQIAALKGDNLSNDVRKSLERAFMNIAGISGAEPNNAGRVVQTEERIALNNVLLNIKVAAISIASSAVGFTVFVLIQWMKGYWYETSIHGIRYNGFIPQGAVMMTAPWSSIFYIAILSFAATRLFVPFNYIRITWIVALTICILLHLRLPWL